jgi:hypothetical protein
MKETTVKNKRFLTSIWGESDLHETILNNVVFIDANCFMVYNWFGNSFHKFVSNLLAKPIKMIGVI